jgi:hypothetical protein
MNVRVARVAPHLAHVRAEGGAWRCGTTATQEKKPATAMPGGRIGEEPDATSC